MRPGDRVLHIGAGRGGLLLRTAEHYDVDATGITLGRNQHASVNRLIEQKGLQGRVRMLLQDYRDIDENTSFDKVASIGMREHVGRPNLPHCFDKICRLLTSGGLVMNHGITVGVMAEAMTRDGLEPLDLECLRPHYAKTLWHWVNAPEANIDAARRVLGKRADKAIRAYRLYLAGSAMAFEHGWISLLQILGRRPDGEVGDRFDAPGALGARQSPYPFNRG